MKKKFIHAMLIILAIIAMASNTVIAHKTIDLCCGCYGDNNNGIRCKTYVAESEGNAGKQLCINNPCTPMGSACFF